MKNDGHVVVVQRLWLLADPFKRMRKVSKGGAAVDVQYLVSVSTKLALPGFRLFHASMLRTKNGVNGTRCRTSVRIVRADHKPKCVIHFPKVAIFKGPQKSLMRAQFGQETAA